MSTQDLTNEQAMKQNLDYKYLLIYLFFNDVLYILHHFINVLPPTQASASISLLEHEKKYK